MNGFMTTRQLVDICKEANCEQPHIVALTASDPSQEILDKSKQCGMNDVMMKPMTFSQLNDLFQKHGIHSNATTAASKEQIYWYIQFFRH